MGLDEVVLFLSQNGLEGALTVCHAAGATLHLYFREGRVICPIPETAPSKRASGRIARQALDDMFDRARVVAEEKKTRRKISGRINRGDLDSILERADELAAQAEAERRERTEEALHEAFSSRDARFEFVPGPLPELVAEGLGNGRVLVYEPNTLLIEVARRADERQRTPVDGGAEDAPEHETKSWGSASQALRGDLDGIGLAGVLQALRTHRRSGTLSVIAGGREEQLYFEQGEVFVLRSDADSEFARFFLGDDVTESVSNLAKSVLDSPGEVREQDLTEAELASIQDSFLELLFWEGAEFAFFQNNLPQEFFEPDGYQLTRIALSTDRFLLEAIRQLTEWDQLRRELGGRGTIFRFVDVEWKLAALRREDLPEVVLTLIDGRRRLEDLVKSSGLQHLEVVRVVATLFREGFVIDEQSESAIAETEAEAG